jgi:hypothetical protein
MDFDPLVKRLQAQLEAVQLQGDVSVTQLAAEVRQVLLATTVDIEQRWQFLNPEDRVAAVSDVVFVNLIYNRLFAESVGPIEALSATFGKALTEAAVAADQAALDVGLLAEEVASAVDALSYLMDYVRATEDAVEMVDVVDVLLTLLRDFSDTTRLSDTIDKQPTKPFEDLGGLYVEAGYFADDYWQAGGPTLEDTLGLLVGKPFADAEGATDAFLAVAAFVRSLLESVAATDTLALAVELGQTDTATLTDQTLWSAGTRYEDSTAATDSAALDFVARMQDLVATAEDFARTVAFARSPTDSATATDSPAKTPTKAIADIGGLYATLGYFADDYVVVGTGPAVYDTFSYTLN